MENDDEAFDDRTKLKSGRKMCNNVSRGTVGVTAAGDHTGVVCVARV